MVQLWGPVTLFGVLAVADGAARGLERAPSSEWLWYINLKWFGMFQESHYALTTVLRAGHYEQFLFVALPLLVCAGLAAVFKRTLLLAASSNLAFVYAILVALGWFRARAPLQASLSEQFSTSANWELIVLAALISLCLLSFVVSHLAYLRRTISELR